MEDKFAFYNQKEIERLIKSQEKLVYVDDGIDEVVVRVKDLPDFIMDVAKKTGHSSNLKIYDFHNPSMTPIATTIGCFLDKCEPNFRNEIIERLIKVQQGAKIKNYKIVDETMLEDVREKLQNEKVLLEYGDIVEYKGIIAEIEDTNDDNYKETIVQIFSSQEDYESKNYDERVSLNNINLEKNIKDYIDTKYKLKEEIIPSEKEYITFVLGYDLLNKEFSNSKFPECDVVYSFCNKLSDKFINTKYFKDKRDSLYEALEKWVEANKSSIKKDYEKFTGIKSEKSYER